MESKQIRILAIDDNQDNLISIKALINEAFPAMEVHTAQSGHDGLALAHEVDPDVILLDVVMPDLDGFGVCLALKASPKLRNIPVVFVTALKDKENRIRALEAGAEGFLTKPIDESELAAQIRAMVKIGAAHGRERDQKQRLAELVRERTIVLEHELEQRKVAEAELRYVNLKLDAFWQIAMLQDADVKTICDYALRSIVKMTVSDYGFYGFVNEDETVMTIHSWSGEAMKGCSMVDKPSEFPIVQAGIWGEAVRQRQAFIINDYTAPHAAKKGLPQGHVLLKKLMVVPVFSHKKIVAVAAVANRVADYTENDTKHLSAFADAVQAVIDRKLIEGRLRNSEEKFATAFRTSPNAIAITRLQDDEFVDVNDTFLALSGYSRAELFTGSSVGLAMWVNPQDRSDVVNDLRMGRTVIGREMLFRSKNEVIITAFFSAQIIKINDVDCVLSSINDISARKQAEENLRQIESRLRQSEKMEAIGTLAGGIAHDFNNVLGGIIGYTDMSLELVDKDSLLDKNLRRVLKAADRAKHLVKQIVAFSRQGVQQKTVVALRPLIEEVIELLTASIPSSVIIKTDLHNDTISILADSTKIHEMLLNLATNAVHAMERKGTLVIRLFAEVIDKEVFGRIGKIAPGEYAVIEIADTGIGMDEQILKKAFDPFFTTKPVGEGTGMGLAVVLGVVQSHGGNVQVESVVGKGSTFRIFLPVTNDVESPDADNGDPKKWGGTERVLFVDDEQVLVEFATESLSSRGYTVIGFTDSREAHKYLQEKISEIDILITDQTMPGITGIELAVLAHQIKKELPVILCTGFSADLTTEKVAQCGITRLILKPYSGSEIRTVIREVFDEK